MVQFDREFAATWVETFYAAYGAEDWAVTNKMLSDMSSWGQQIYADHINASEALDVIIVGLNRLNVAVPAGVTVARDAFTGIDWRVATIEKASVAPSLSRRAKLIIIGSAAVAAAAYVYHRRRRAAQRAEDLEAVKSLLAGDSASSLDAAAVTPQRRTQQSRPSAKERSKVMDRNKKLMARSRAAEQARDAAAAEAARARADNERLRAENARLASNATAGDERDAARAEGERLRAEGDRLRAEVTRLSASADAAAVDALRRDNASLRTEIAELEANLQSSNSERDELAGSIRSIKLDAALKSHRKTRAEAQLRNREARLEQAHDALNAVTAERDRFGAEMASLIAERDALRYERDALEEDARLVPAPSAGDLAALSDEALAAFSAEAAALSHKLVSEDARRAAIATTSTNECVVCHERPLEVAFGCGHFCTCVECGISAKISKCPICRAPVTDRRRIFAS